MRIFIAYWFICLLFFFPSILFAAGRKVVVTVPNAIVYSDLNLNSPIGKIPLGKMIRVGKVKRKYSTVVPIIVAGRVAYISDSDVTEYSKWIRQTKGEEFEKLRATEHDVDIVLKKLEDRLSENNHMVIGGGYYSLGSEWNTLSQEFGDETGGAVLNAKLIFEHRPIVHSWSWGVGLGYHQSNQASLNLQIVALDLMAHYTIFNFFDLISMEVSFGTTQTAAFTLQTKNGDSYTGALFGYLFGAQFRIFPHSKIGFVAGIQNQIIRVSGMDTIVIDSEVARTATLNSFSGAQVFAGVSYRF